MKPDLESSPLRTGRQHGAAIVGDDETDGLPQTLGEGTAPVGCPRVGPIEIVLATIGVALRNRRRFAGKLEGKLHYRWGLEVCSQLVNHAFERSIGRLESSWMRDATREPLEGLTVLHRLTTSGQRKAAWRQGMATLARAVVDERRPVPLEGLDPEALLRSVEVAVEAGLVDRLDWLSRPAAAAALYEVAAALPASAIKRQLGRMVVQRLRSGDAPTFVSVATQLALGSERALSGRSIRGRVALALSLPIGTVKSRLHHAVQALRQLPQIEDALGHNP